MRPGMPVLGPQTGIGPWPAGNQATQQGVSGRQAGRAPAVCAAAPQGQRLRLGSASGRQASGSHRSPGPRYHAGRGRPLQTAPRSASARQVAGASCRCFSIPRISCGRMLRSEACRGSGLTLVRDPVACTMRRRRFATTSSVNRALRRLVLTSPLSFQRSP